MDNNSYDSFNKITQSDITTASDTYTDMSISVENRDKNIPISAEPIENICRALKPSTINHRRLKGLL